MRNFWLGRVALFFLIMPVLAQAENWPRFRGPTGQGESSETNLPLKWSESENLAWKVQVPHSGWSSPIVWSDRVFLTGTSPDGISCHVMCFNAEDGKLLWNTQVFEQTPTRKEQQNSYATPTPITDGQKVYAFFSGGGAAALTFDGKIAWTNTDHPFYSRHGLGASPALYNDLLFLSYDLSDPKNETLGWTVPWDKSYLLALDKNSGKERWRTQRGMTRQAHGAPQIRQVDGKPQLVSHAGDVIQGFDPESGKILWWIKNPGEGVVPSPVFGDGMLFSSSGFPTAFGGQKFYAAIRAFKLGGSGDLTKQLVWEEKKAVPMIPSFAFFNHMLFTVKEDGIAQCLDAKTGNVLWKQRLDGHYEASPVVAEGRIYYLSDDAVTTVISADRQFKSLAQNPLHEHCQASMAISNGKFYIRTQGHLYCIAAAHH